MPNGAQILELLSDPARFNAGPVILGSNRDEAKLFMMMDPHFTRRVWGVPVLTKNEDDYARLTDYGSLMWKADAVDELAIVLSQQIFEAFEQYVVSKAHKEQLVGFYLFAHQSCSL